MLVILGAFTVSNASCEPWQSSSADLCNTVCMRLTVESLTVGMPYGAHSTPCHEGRVDTLAAMIVAVYSG